jgi:hypothetical protein
VPTLNRESATNSSESMKLGKLLNVTSFTEAPRVGSYAHHTGHSPMSPVVVPPTQSRQARHPLGGFLLWRFRAPEGHGKLALELKK